MSNPPGGNAAPKFLNLKPGSGMGGLQGNYFGAGRGDAPPVVSLHSLILCLGPSVRGLEGVGMDMAGCRAGAMCENALG